MLFSLIFSKHESASSFNDHKMWTTEPQDMYLVSSLPLLFLPPSSYQFYFYLFSPCFWFLLLIHFWQHFIIHVLTVRWLKSFLRQGKNTWRKKKMSSQYRELESLQTHNLSALYTYELCTYVCNSSLLFPAFSVFTFLLNPPIK